MTQRIGKPSSKFTLRVRRLASSNFSCLVFTFNNEGVCDEEDQCPNADDSIDLDGNGIPDACEMCADNIVQMTNSDIVSDEEANLTIQTNGVVNSGQAIEYNAAVSIEMMPDFEVHLSAIYHAYISPCN